MELQPAARWPIPENPAYQATIQYIRQQFNISGNNPVKFKVHHINIPQIPA
jgi:hypothetical protein